MTVWGELAQAEFLREVLALGSLELAAIGAPRSADAGALAAAFDVERLDDLRHPPGPDLADVHWLMAPAPITAEARRALAASGVPVVSSEPRPLDLDDLLEDPHDADVAAFAPRMRRGPGFRSAIDALTEFGRAETIWIAMASASSAGTLFARLFDAMDVLLSVGGTVVSVDAALAGPPGPVPETLRELQGHLTLNARLADGRAAVIATSHAAGTWFRDVRLLGPGGVFRIGDTGYVWDAPDGPETGGTSAPATAAAVFADQLVRCAGGMADDPGPDVASIFALCEAARLSCRTGDGETPERVRQRLRRR
jgi:hypothetical protein